VAKSKAQKIGRRHSYYLAHIEACLDAARLGPRQRERVMEAGWTKLKAYARLIDRSNFDEWTSFALGNPIEVVEQAARRGRPSVPRTPVQSIMFRVRRPVKDALVAALERRDWVPEPGKRGGRRKSVEPALVKLLADAGDWPPAE